MPPKHKTTIDHKKSFVIVPSRIVSRPDEAEGGEETEITAQITIPHDGGWGWVVVFTAFWSIFILDGVCYTFGTLITDVTQDIGVSESASSLVNSMAVALNMLAAPLASAFINRFGFRACNMTGSVICAFSLLCTYFSTNYAAVFLFYGFIAGFGYSMINMASCLVAGFYFEKYRSLALALATSGSSCGMMIMYPVNSYIVQVAGWRVVTLLHSGLFGIVFYLGMAYKPLLSLSVVKTTDEATKTVTYLPSFAVVKGVQSQTSANKESLTPTATERIFGAVSNSNFPTAAAVIHEGNVTTATQAGPSTRTASKLTLTAQSPQSVVSQRQLKLVQSIISRATLTDKSKRSLEVEIAIQVEPKKRSCWARLCHWEPHVPQSRPMYRDDVFYGGEIKDLPVYQKSMMETSEEPKTGLEYQLAVSRAVTTVDLQERRGVFTTAARRILATMMDPKLLKRCSFLLLCCSACFTFLGYLVPYVFIESRNKSYGVDPKHCAFFVSVIGFSNTLGRIILGAISSKFDPVKLFSFSLTCAGLGTLLSDISFNVFYQYFCWSVFGCFISSIASIRSMVIVKLYGLEKLTNATGMLLMFQGLGSLFCTPIASILKQNYGFAVPFYVAGTLITLSGIILIPVNRISRKEINTV